MPHRLPPGSLLRRLLPRDLEEQTYADLCAIVRGEIAYRLSKGETLPTPAVRATRDLDFAAA